VATYARGSKTYQGALRLSDIGYGGQALMLGRSLYEDMLVAHWIKLNPERAPRQLDDHRRMTLAVYKGQLSRFGLDAPSEEPIDRAERERLRQEFGSGHWTKLSVDKLRPLSRSSPCRTATGGSFSRSTNSCTATPASLSATRS
jgi:hypothetical protein